jgi:hypothetical protein
VQARVVRIHERLDQVHNQIRGPSPRRRFWSVVAGEGRRRRSRVWHSTSTNADRSSERNDSSTPLARAFSRAGRPGRRRAHPGRPARDGSAPGRSHRNRQQHTERHGPGDEPSMPRHSPRLDATGLQRPVRAAGPS